MVNDGGPAHPIDGASNGITIRDYYAAAAIQGLLANSGKMNLRGVDVEDAVAKAALSIADKMVEYRNAELVRE
jgi:hypothetical protein